MIRRTKQTAAKMYCLILLFLIVMNLGACNKKQPVIKDVILTDIGYIDRADLPDYLVSEESGINGTNDIIAADEADNAKRVEITDIPSADNQPVVTDIPVSDAQLLVTDRPEADEQLAVIGIPNADEQLVVTGIPNADDKLVATGIPKVDEQPMVTGIPKADEQPMVTRIPKADIQPEITKLPEVTKKPDVAKKPEVIKEPDIDKALEEVGCEDKNKAIDSFVNHSIATFLNSLTAPQKGLLLEQKGAVPVYYYRQTDSRWSKLYYGGTDTIGKYACGPTSMSIIISSFTENIIDPVQMSKWACDNGYWYPESGSLHSLIPDAASAFGLNVTGIPNDSEAAEKIEKALSDGKLIVALMGKGHFTNGGHFIVLRGIDSDGKILVADPASTDRTNQSWELSLIVEEARPWAAADGPFWIISK